MADDFDDPEPHRLTLHDGKFIDIRKRLNSGEREDMFARISPTGIGMNRREVRTAKILAYVLGWSLTRKGQPVPMSPDLPENVRVDTIRNLNTDRFDEIHTAIETHEEAMSAERAAQKKILPGSPDANATLASPSGSAGASSGSEG